MTVGARVTAAPLSIDPEHPWLGLSSYTEETRAYFHGRDEEAADRRRFPPWCPVVADIGFNAITRKRLRDRQQVVSGTGTTAGATGTVLTDSGKTWTVNEWTGKYLRYVTGPATGQIKQISSNTGTTITTPAFSPVSTGGGSASTPSSTTTAPR